MEISKTALKKLNPQMKSFILRGKMTENTRISFLCKISRPGGSSDPDIIRLFADKGFQVALIVGNIFSADILGSQLQAFLDLSFVVYCESGTFSIS